MSDAHPSEAVAALRQLALGSGGSSLIVSAETESAPVYAGLHRAPASTLLEAVCTFIAQTYDEVVLFAGRGDHLPPLKIEGSLRLAVGRAVVYLRRPSPEPVPDDGVRDPATRFLPDFDKRRRQRTARLGRIELDAASMEWRTRVPQLLDRIERWCGVDLLGHPLTRFGPPLESRRLILIDAEFLVPDLPSWQRETDVGTSEQGHLPARLARIPEIVRGTRNDVIMLARDVAEATSLEDGQLILRRLDDRAVSHKHLLVKWRGVRRVTLSSGALNPDFAAHYPTSVPVAYQHFRQIPPVNPRTWRPLPLQTLTAQEIVRRLLHTIKGQDAALRAIATTIARNVRKRTPEDTRPIACFLLAGPTGSGKTATATALATALFGDSSVSLHRAQMEQCRSEFELFGVPKGYVGWRAEMLTQGGGLLTGPLVRHPDRPVVILLDELEKSFEGVHDHLFGALDAGVARDASADRNVSFRNAVVVVTTNEASAQLAALSSTSLGWDDLVREAKDTICTHGAHRWSQAFLARFRDGVIPMCYPDGDDLRSIVIEATRTCVEESYRHAFLRVDDQFVNLVCESYRRESGVRGIQDRIEQLIGGELAALPVQPGFGVVVTRAGVRQVPQEAAV